MNTAKDHDPGDGFRADALLLTGPTGSGKTPLGDHLQRTGIGGRRCVHFDFGATLRRVARGDTLALKPGAVDVIRHAVETGALLENEHFPIARQLLSRFLKDRGVSEGDLLIMNGLPRHIGQAEGLSPIVAIHWVIVLECSPRIAMERIRRNTGGDRLDRSDDDPGAVEDRIRLFQERMLPLIAYFQKFGSRIIRIPVGSDTDPESIRREWLSRLPAPF